MLSCIHCINFTYPLLQLRKVCGNRHPAITQPRRAPESEEEEDQRPSRTEADLRGSLNNDSLTEDEIRQIEEDRERAQAAADLRDEDYQLAYAIDILKGLSALGPTEE